MGTRIVLTHRMRSKVVGTLRVPLYFYPYWRDLDDVEHYQERHKECAYYFFFDLGPRHFPYCIICPRGHKLRLLKTIDKEYSRFRLVKNQTKRSVSFEVVGTLRVPLYFYPYWRLFALIRC